MNSRDKNCHAHAEAGDKVAEEEDGKEGWYGAEHDGFKFLQRGTIEQGLPFNGIKVDDAGFCPVSGHVSTS